MLITWNSQSFKSGCRCKYHQITRRKHQSVDSVRMLWKKANFNLEIKGWVVFQEIYGKGWYIPKESPETWKQIHMYRQKTLHILCQISLLECCWCAQLWPTLCNSMYYSLPGSSAHGIFQARILEWVAIPFSRGSSQPRDQTCISCVGRGFFSTETQGDPSLARYVSSSTPGCEVEVSHLKSQGLRVGAGWFPAAVVR